MTPIYRYERKPGRSVHEPVAVTLPVRRLVPSAERDRQIRRLAREGKSQMEIARTFRIAQQHVSRILKGIRSGTKA